MSYYWLESMDDKKEWQMKNRGKLTISNEYFFNNANVIMNHDVGFRNTLIEGIVGEINIKTKIRKKGSLPFKGVEIGELNKCLRESLSESNQFLFEVYNEDGIFYTSNAKKGFDFAKIDREYNIINLWNLCFGKRGLYNGDLHWKSVIESNDFMNEVAALKGYDCNSFMQGVNQDPIKNSLTILGELQFGNWGLVYRDFFKLLHADTNSGVDLFVYITADKNLLNYASDGIVSYEATIEVLKEFSNLIKVPVWVIGLDLEVY